MGFTTGFVGGLTLTYSILYLTIHMHRQNRLHQATLLNQQRTLLTHLYDPPSEIYDSPAYEVRPAGLSEQLKDRWNRELGNVVRDLQEKDWAAVRSRWEDRAGNVWRAVSGSEVVKDAKEKLAEVGESAKDKVASVKDNFAGAGNDVKRDVKELTGQKRLLEV